MTHNSDLPAEIWRDTTTPVAARVADLMSRMTVREKLAQMYGVWIQVDELAGAVAPHQKDQSPDPLDWDDLIRHGLGQLTRVYGSGPIDPVDGARRVASLQGQIVAAGRFGLPAIVHEEILTGLAAWRATIYPSPLCWGASFDPDLIEQVGAQIGALMRRLGIQQGLAPVLDVARDLRWGRIEETIAEDPYLVGIVGSGYVRGVESAGVVATLKHFVGYSASRAGRNLAPVSIGAHEIADVLLPPFEMALQAGARSVMSNYTDLDGVPVAADPVLLTEVLRERYGFTGTVVSDYFGIAFLEMLHGVAGNRAQAAELALRAGIDVELPGVNCYGPPLLEAVESGQIDLALVDRAVTRILRQKCELGLLDPDWSVRPPALSAGTPPQIDDEASRALARRLAQRSIVLLRNGSSAGEPPAPILPLRPGLRLAVVGPGADEPDAMLGCYSFPRHVGVHHPELSKGVAIPSVVDSLRADPAGYDVRYAQGCPVVGGDDEGIAAATAAAGDADVCVAVLGDLAGLFGVGTSGEGCDAVDLRLPGRQEELLEALLGTGTPVVLVLLLGRPYELGRQVDRLSAALCAFFPGEEGAPAVADVLSGRVNPSGHLPISFPAVGASQPHTYLAAPLGQRNEVSNVDPTPLFAFGHGLSYAPVAWDEVTLNSPSLWSTEGSCRLSVTLRNESHRDSSEVVQVYLHDPVAEVVRPVQRLIGTARVDLAAGQSCTVLMDLHADLTSYTGLGGRRIVDPGEVQLWVGASSADIRARICLTMTGPRRDAGFDRVMQPKVTVLEEDTAVAGR
jgi:beta-glucosidase